MPEVGAVPSGDRNPRARAFCFTINGYTAEVFEALSRIVLDEAKEYICYQKEVAPTTGQRHIQGYISFANARRFNAVRTLIPGNPHIEIARGSAQANREYCSKEGGTDFTERGTIKRQGERNDLNEVQKLCAQGASIREICDEHPEVYIKYSTGITRMLGVYSKKRDFKSEVYWMFGPTGSGKSYTAARMAGPNAYHKMGGNKWWDHYDNNESVVINDFRRDLCTFSELLRLFDRYPHRVEGKGTSMEFVSKTIYVTCPKDPREAWRGDDGNEREDIGQLLRRIEHVIEFTERLWEPTDEQPDAPHVDHGRAIDMPERGGGQYAPGFNPPLANGRGSNAGARAGDSGVGQPEIGGVREVVHI